MMRCVRFSPCKLFRNSDVSNEFATSSLVVQTYGMSERIGENAQLKGACSEWLNQQALIL